MPTFALLVIGLVALVLGAEVLVRGASRMALALGISPLVVGLTIVAIGTSAPEVAVSVGAALQGQADIAVGNVVGSNIFNVLVILGLSALIVPLAVSVQIVRQEVPIMIGASLLLVSFGLDGRIGRWDAGVLLVLMVAYLVFLVRQSRREQATLAYAGIAPTERPRALPLWANLLLVAAGLALLVMGARWLVEGAVALARDFGVSERVIGLTIVAAGTSLPEVATSIMAALRGERDIAIGNVIGSNIFNILGCLGLAGLVAGTGLAVSEGVRGLDLWVMTGVALACLPVFLARYRISRLEGGMFVALYAAYLAYLVLGVQGSPLLPRIDTLATGVGLPLLIVLLVVNLARRA